MAYYNGKRNQEKTRKQRLVLGWAKKLKAINILGGKCDCGEHRPWILEFHHLDETLKENEISFLKHLSWERLEAELSKCKLVCRNCHGDIHFKHNFIAYESEIREKVIEDNFVTKVDHEQVLQLNLEGFSQSKIAAKLNCGVSTVCEILKSNGIHTLEKRKKIDPLEVIFLRESGLTNVEIGLKLNIHRFSVPHIIKKWKEKNDSKHS